MDQSHIEQAAALLWRTRVERKRIEALPDHLRPRSLAEGYAIQDAMVATAAQPVSGWKIAATSKAGQEHIGVTEPLAGRLFKNFVLEDGARLPAAAYGGDRSGIRLLHGARSRAEGYRL